MTSPDTRALFPPITAAGRRARPDDAGIAGSVRPARGSAVELCPTGFALFLLLTAILFIRPADFVPDLEGWPFYEVVILLCLAASLPAVQRQLAWQSLKSSPAHLCVMGLLPAIVLSHLRHGDTWYARFDGLSFLKVLVYYFLLVGLLTSRRRLHTFLGVLLVFIIATAILSVLTYHGVLDISGLKPVDQHMGVDAYDQAINLPRLKGPGIFNDPNDFSLVLVTGMVIAAQFFLERRLVLRRLFCAGAIACIGYAFFLTSSRGGFLALIGAFTTFLLCRYSWRRAVLVLILALPLALLLLGGRQTNIDVGDSNDTAQGRMQLWRDSLVLFHHSPIFGIGCNQLGDEIGHVAHNSYVQGFAELGLIGGTLFIGAVYIPFWELSRLVRRRAPAQRGDWTGSVLAILVGYAVGLFSLTRTYMVSTYVILGLAIAFATVAAAEHPEFPAIPPKALVRRIAIVTMGTLILLELICRFMIT